MVPVAAGLALFFLGREPPVATAPDPLRGNLLAALSGVAFAVSVIGMRWLGRGAVSGTTPLTAAAMGNFVACLAALPLALPLGSHAPGDWLLLGYLGVVQIGLAYYLVATALTHLGALEASLILLLEPALNPVWSWLVHGERPAAPAVVGGALVLGATLARAWWDGRLPAAPRT